MFGEFWLLLFLALVIVGLAGRYGFLVALGGMGLVVVALAWVWSRLSLERLTYSRTLSRHRVFPGEEVSLAVSLTNRKPLPLTWVRVDDDFPEGVDLEGKQLAITSRRKVNSLVHSTSLGRYERVRWEYRLRCRERGYFRLGPAQVRTGDLFGFFPRVRHDLAGEFLLVYPRAVPLPELGLPARRPMGDRRGVERLHQDPARPMGIREYTPGDPMKFVDWKATARHGNLQVKVFEPGVTPLLMLLLNIDTVGVTWGGYVPQNLERVVTAAASVAQGALAEGYSVGYASNGKSVQYELPMRVPPGRHPQQLPLIFESLAMASPYVACPMEEVMVQEAAHLPLGATPVLITAIMTPGLAESLSTLLRRGQSPVVLWLADWPPEGLPEGATCHNLAPHFAQMEQERAKAR
ncbi:MAG: DUF58 domain-containing protein [Chloroflexi bacterium]|nr:DUF58 domain-containing protein [Chloroflexota bacterium]